jgi:PST family polysaccharide transporter
MAVLAFSIVIPMTFFSGHIIDLLYGPEFAGAGSVLAIHIWAAVFVFLGVAQGPWTVNEGLMKLSLQRTVIGAVANVVLNLLLIPRIGVVGAAISTLIAQALSSCILNRFDRRTRRIFTLQMRALVVWRDIR